MNFYRVGRWCHLHGIPIVPALVTDLIFLIFHCFLPMSVEIGKGTQFSYGGMGIAVHPKCRIGKNVILAPRVTIGGRARRNDLPVIEDGCHIGIGACILGPVRVGRDSIVGANAVVVDDVPPRAVVAGVPARIVRTGIDAADYK